MKRKLQGLIEKYKDVPKKPAYTYSGPLIGASLSVSEKDITQNFKRESKLKKRHMAS